VSRPAAGSPPGDRPGEGQPPLARRSRVLRRAAAGGLAAGGACIALAVALLAAPPGALPAPADAGTVPVAVPALSPSGGPSGGSRPSPVVATPAGAPAGTPAGPAARAVPAARAASAAPTPPAARPRPAPAGGRAPVRLQVPSLGVDARVRPVRAEPGGSLDLPADPRDVGWWADGAAAGATDGTVVLAGHVDDASRGPGALARLRDARPGAAVVLGTAGGSRTYVVTGRRSYPKQRLPSAVFTPAGPARLVLITCTGAFDPATGSYADNLVVYAVPRP